MSLAGKPLKAMTSGNADRVASELRPFYFTTIFWGAVYREYFTDLLLPSFLSPGNIPALNRERSSKFLIVTTRADWEALQNNSMFQLLKKYVEPVLLEMPFPDISENKMLVMSRGQKALTTRAFEDGAYGVFVTPDVVLSDGSINRLQCFAEEGKKVVLVVAHRFSYESLLPHLQREGYIHPGRVAVLPPRDLLRIALQHLHSETRQFEFPASHFSDCPIAAYWNVPGGNGIILHTFSWCPMLVDFSSIRRHDVSTFDSWTLDGDYICRNFPDPEDVYIVTDSDEIMLVGFTKEAELHYKLVPQVAKMIPLFGSLYKMQLIKRLKDSSVMDDLKRKVFPVPVYLHSGDISSVWATQRARTDKIIKQVYAPLRAHEFFVRAYCFVIRFVNVLSSDDRRLHICNWLKIRMDRLAPIIGPALDTIGLTVYARRIGRRTLRIIGGTK